MSGTGYKNRMQIHALIPVHNRIDVSMECLGYLKAQTLGDLKIVVVDDGSTDGTCESIKAKYPDVEVLKGDGNLWWTGAMHLGVEYILGHAKDGDFILSMNNDIAFETDFVESLVAMSLRYGRAMVGSMEMDYFNRDEILYRGEWLDWKDFRFIVEAGPIPDETAVCNEHVNLLPGRGLLIPVEVFKKIGNFDKKRFPHYIADYDFTLRAFEAGIKLVLSYKSAVYSRRDISGVAVREARPLTLKEAYRTFFSIKSDQNLKDIVNFIWVHCPKEFRNAYIYNTIIGRFSRVRVLIPLSRFLVFTSQVKNLLVRSAARLVRAGKVF